MLHGLKLKGYKQLFGVELSNDRRKVAKSIIKNVFNDVNKIKKTKFDVIILNHVLEHIVDIQSVIKILKSKLNANGIIIINVPNSLYENIISQIVFHPHLHKFNLGSINELANKNRLCMNIIKGDRSDEISVFFSRKRKKMNFKNKKTFIFLKRFENLILSSINRNHILYTHSKSGLIQHLSEDLRTKTYIEIRGFFKFFYVMLFNFYKINFKLLRNVILKILRLSSKGKINNFGYYVVNIINFNKTRVFPISVKLNNKDNTLLMK